MKGGVLEVRVGRSMTVFIWECGVRGWVGLEGKGTGRVFLSWRVMRENNRD